MGRRPKEQKIKKKIKRLKLKKFVSAPDGMPDILPKENILHRKIIKVTREISDYYGFNMIDLPIMERAEVFNYSIGEKTDFVKNKIINFKVGNSSISLRPDFTPSIMRAYLENSMSSWGKPVKLSTFGPLFNQESLKSGRRQQIWQSNFAIIGEDDPIYDALTIQVMKDFLSDLRIKNLSIEVNTVGCDNCHLVWKSKFKEYFSSKKSKMCNKCRQHHQINPFQIFGCLSEKCQEILDGSPKMMDYLCLSCRKHFMSLLEYLESAEIQFTVNHKLTKSFDYNTRTIFEIRGSNENLVLANGGRYDYLSETLGGRSTQGVGCLADIDRLSEVLKKQQHSHLLETKNKIFLVLLGDLAKKKGLFTLEILRKSGILVAEAFGKESLKAQFIQAEKMGILIIVILGQKEAADGTAIIRDLKSGAQEIVALDKLTEELKRKFKNVII